MKIKRKTKIKNRIPVSSMSDIAFLLLIFLMLSSILNMKKGPNVVLPKAQEISLPEEARKYEITVDKNGNYFFDGNYLPLAEITAFFSAEINIYPNLYVQISADQNSEYEVVDSLVKALQDAKSYRFVFVTDKLKNGGTP